MDALDHLNVALNGKWLAFQIDDEGDFEPRRIETIVEGDADDAVVLVATGDREDGTTLERLDLTDFTFWDEESDCVEWCNEQNAIAEADESKQDAASDVDEQ